ncbi:MAG: FG-GAP repeat domain-containing protein [Xanthobacteraceae bacterium]
MTIRPRPLRAVAALACLVIGVLGMPLELGLAPLAQSTAAAEPTLLHLQLPPPGAAAPLAEVSNFRCHILPVQDGYGVRAPGQPGYGVAPPRPDCDVKATPGAAATASTDLNNHGGPVITSTQHTFMFLNCPANCFSDWGDPYGFLTDLFASTFLHVVDQYVGSHATARYATSNTGLALTGAQPHVLTDAQLQTLVLNGVKSLFPNGGGGGYNRMYSIFLPQGQDLCFTSAAGAQCYCPDANCNSGTFAFCAYHGAFDSTDAKGNAIHIIYQAQPYLDVSGCRVSNGPNGTLKDSTNNVFSHEIIETITDPDLNAWWRTSDGQEIGDICNFNIVNPIVLNSRNYAIQKEYSNQAHACVNYYYLPTTHDFNQSGTSDIAWRDSSGNTAIWLINGAAIAGSGGLGNVATTWAIVGQRDFDGDGKHDWLWRDSSGNTAVWYLNGTTLASAVLLGNVSTTWSIVGTGDFNGDGAGDILWRDGSGNTALWFLRGGSVVGTGGIGNVSTVWSIVGTGDFNADGKTDILWRDSSGNTAVWLMNGSAVLSSAGLGNVSTSWNIVATGDFDGDGNLDILWRDGSGAVAIWFLNGTTVASSAFVGNVAPSWTIQQTGDFNGDSKSDILWRDGSGNTAVWFMNGASIASSAGFGTVSTAWTIQNLNAD